MDRQTLAELVRESTAPGERPQDFGLMIDTLVALPPRRSFVRGAAGRVITLNTPRAAYAVNRAWFLCLLLKPKPPEYVEAMHQFRRAFTGIADDSRLAEVFTASIRSRLLSVTRLDPRLLRPSHFFDLDKAIERAAQADVKFDRPQAWY